MKSKYMINPGDELSFGMIDSPCNPFHNVNYLSGRDLLQNHRCVWRSVVSQDLINILMFKVAYVKGKIHDKSIKNPSSLTVKNEIGRNKHRINQSSS